jgi:hypothetical protein
VTQLCSVFEVCVPYAQDLISNRERVRYSILDLRKGTVIREITEVSEILTEEFASQVHHGRFSISLFVKGYCRHTRLIIV